jgi:hypothetical protein
MFVAASGEWKSEKLLGRIEVRWKHPGQKRKPEPPQLGEGRGL